MATKAAGERVRVWRPPALPGVEVMRVERSHRLWRWYHEVHALFTVYEGAAEYRYRRDDHSACPGDTLMMEPGEVHVMRRVERPTSFRVLFVAPEVLARFRHDGRDTPLHLRLARIQDASLFGAASALHDALDRDASPLEAQCRLALVLDELLRRFVEPAPRPAPVDAAGAALLRARDLLHASPGRAVSLDELAAAAGLSKFHLLRAFTKRFGLPPHTYHTQLRIATARALLANGVPISRVALEAGFADQSHLTRHFARNVGVTPGAYVRGTLTRTSEPPPPSPHLAAEEHEEALAAVG